MAALGFGVVLVNEDVGGRFFEETRPVTEIRRFAKMILVRRIDGRSATDRNSLVRD